jgi:2-isopropylmalate synthase
MMAASVEITGFDTTPRDGAQSLPEEHQFQDGAKPAVVASIAKLGMGVIEAGFPATPKDGEEVAEVARTVGRTEYTVDVWRNGEPAGQTQRSPIIAGLSRVAFGDIETTWIAVNEARRARIHTFVSTDPEHMAKKFPDKSPEQVLVMGREAVRFAKDISSEHPDATVEFSAEAASTTDTAYLERIIKEALNQGADVINVPDTVGQRDPLWMRDFYLRVIDWVMKTNPEATISAHNHNDLGLAVANTTMLAMAAVSYANIHGQSIRIQQETTVCGLGERAGNADVFPTVASLFKFSPDMNVPIQWEFNPGNSVGVASEVMKHTGLTIDRQSPVVGSDINRHRSGIHSDGVIKGGHKLYTPLDPTFWGHESDAVHEAGKYQGKRGRTAASS